MYANNTYRYFSMVLRSAPKNFSTRLKPALFLKNSTGPEPPVCCAYPAPPVPVSALEIRHPPYHRRVEKPVYHTPLIGVYV